MKKSKICPKCNSNQVLRFDGYHGAYGSGNNLVTGMFSAVNVNRYICCSCGYTEDLEKVLNSKKAVNP